MAIKDLVSGAWQDISTLKIPVNGAYQEASSSKALVSGAWQDVWTNSTYYMKAGAFANGASIYSRSGWNSTFTTTGGRYKIYNAYGSGDSSILIRIPKNNALVGKTLYFVLDTSGDYFDFLYFNDGSLPTNFAFQGSGVWTLTLPSTSSNYYYLGAESYSYSYGNTYYIKDIYVK